MYQQYLFRRNKQSVPILSKYEIDDIAEGYAIDYCPEILSCPKPFNIDLFLEEYLGLILDYQHLSNSGIYLGMTVFNDTSRVQVYVPETDKAEFCSASAGTVIIDTSLTEDKQINRYRYTCGHEAGHWVLHHEYFYYDPLQLSFFESDTPFIRCREISVSDFGGNRKEWDEERWMEWQADKFSAALLMPKTAVRKLITDIPSIQDHPSSLTLMVSEKFQVSAEAAYYRLLDLNILDTYNREGQLSFY